MLCNGPPFRALKIALRVGDLDSRSIHGSLIGPTRVHISNGITGSAVFAGHSIVRDRQTDQLLRQ